MGSVKIQVISSMHSITLLSDRRQPPAMTNRSTRRGDRSDNFLALAISIALHLTVAIWVLMGAAETRQQPLGAGLPSASLSSRFLGEDEFRQPLVTASPIKPIQASDPEPGTATDHTVAPTLETKAAEMAEATELLPDSLPTSPASASAAQEAGLSGPESSAVDPPLEDHSYNPTESAYLTALRAAIQSKWIRHDKQHGRCSITIQQTIGGRVVSATSTSCMLNDTDRRALEAATLAAQPLPYAGFEQVFRENMTVQMGE